MKSGHHGFPPEEFNDALHSCGITAPMKDYLNQCVVFHTSPAPGVLIGAFMVDYALDLLGASVSDKLYGVCETPKCLPDSLQAIAHCTTGNNRLRVVPIGKFAITVNATANANGETAEAVRVYVDSEKLKKFPVIDIWYANSPEYDKSTMNGKLQEAIFRAGRGILSCERVTVKVSPKRKWKPVTCPVCGDSIPDYLFGDGLCGSCSSLRYYEKIPGQ